MFLTHIPSRQALTLVVLLVAVIAAAVFSLRNDDDLITLELASQPGTCTGFFEGWSPCVQVRESGQSDWEGRLEPIRGFDFEPGYRYRLQVRRVQVDIDGYQDDAPQAFYDELVRIDSREPVRPLTITIASNENPIRAGQLALVSYRVRNDLPIPVRLLEIEVAVPDGAVFVTSDPILDRTSMTWTIEHLTVRESVGLGVTYELPFAVSGGSLEVVARALSINGSRVTESKTLLIPTR